jgi:hypothetical protein
MQEDPDGEHQENVLATGMGANSRPRDIMTKTARPPTEAASSEARVNVSPQTIPDKWPAV